MARISLGILGFVALGGVFLFGWVPNSFVVSPVSEAPVLPEDLPDLPEAGAGALEEEDSLPIPPRDFGDIGPQAPLASPPSVVKGIYLTGWSAGSARKMQDIVALIRRTELNGVIIDIKDYSGYVSYVMDVPEVKEAGADREIRIARPNALIKMLHDNGIYVIGRVTVFQDPILAKARPEWAMQKKDGTGVWTDHKGIAWMDPAATGVWDYNVAIAEDAFRRGFDEVNFDYIRFASDGNLREIRYPFWDELTPRHIVIRDFFRYLRKKLSGRVISADLFGLATINRDDLGIGQVIEDAYEYFDYVCPMVYPSHYARGFIGYQNPGAHPYEVMKYSLDRALERWTALGTHRAGTSTVPGIPFEKLGKLRPWIQDFDLGATYTAGMVRSEFQATYDALLHASTSAAYAGWLMWDPANTYTEAALERN